VQLASDRAAYAGKLLGELVPLDVRIGKVFLA
jgi:hypothetical protein